MSLPPVKLNLIDRAIEYFAPRAAARRVVARQAIALAGGYTGAKKNRASLADWATRGGSPDSDVIADLPMLRERSRDAERNQPVATGIIGTTVLHSVGTGLTCHPQVNAKWLGMTDEQAESWQDDTSARFLAWFGSKDCDLGRRQTGYEMQDLALRSVLTSGDTFVLTPRVKRRGQAAEQLALQMIEADRVSNPNLGRDTDTLTDGIECDPVTGEALAAHIANHHPGDLRGHARTWERREFLGTNTGRRNLLHLYKVLRPGLRRGVPILAPVIEPLKQLSRFSQAELDAAVSSALLPLFAEMDPEAFDETFSPEDQTKIVERATKWTGSIESMQVMNLLPGEKVTTPAPGRPNPAFDPFFTACVRQIGMATGIPFEVLVMHYQSSYSAAKGALLMAWRFFNGWRDFLVTNFCQPIYELWLADEVAAGRIAAPGFFADPVTRAAWCATQWVGDGPGSLDPLKDVTAAEKRVNLEISTLQYESQQLDGVSWDTKHRQRVKEIRAQKRDGTAMAPAAAPGAPAEPPDPAEPADPADDPAEDDSEDTPSGTPAFPRGRIAAYLASR